MRKRVADIIVETLAEKGIADCFEVVGGGAMHLNHALVQCEEIRKIFCHHEQACAMAAEAYARVSGKTALVCVTSGPGGLNTLNGVEGAWVDSLPMVVLAGQPRIETSVAYTGLKLRTRGVQEFEITESVKNMTKYAVKLTNPLLVKKEVEKAVDIAMSGRRGPVWIDVPLDIQAMIVEEEEMVRCEDEIKIPEVSDEEIIELYSVLRAAKRPCLLTGSGIRTSDATEKFRECADILKLPIVGGALQADILYNGHPFYFGMSGNIGPRAGNFILQNADVILVLGNSLSFKQTGFNQSEFAPKAKIYMVDVDENEAKKFSGREIHLIHSDLNLFFDKILKVGEAVGTNEEWYRYCRKVCQKYPVYELEGEAGEKDRVAQIKFWEIFNEKVSKDAIVALGNSSCVHGKLQTGIYQPNQRVLVNYNSGSMGDDLPEAIGAAVAEKREVICVTGDGSFMMNMQELQTLIHNNLPIKIIVFSNQGYGAIRQTCRNFFGGQYTGCDAESGISFPEFRRVAEAFEIPYKNCENNGEIQQSIQWLLEQEKYAFLEIQQRLSDMAIPKVMSKMDENNAWITPALQDMYPFLDKREVDEWML